ncbi:MAG: transporter substrate-binding domain-containing protein [Desulfobacteraceae bacterium]|nr:transporter substrate-binding domain-containing protein [Desulfobacteraceae bacterium]
MNIKKRYIATLVFISIFSSVSIGNADEKDQTGKATYAFSGWEPFSYIDEQGEVKGLYIDILREIFDNDFGVPLGFHARPWKRAQLSVETGEADFLVTIATEERLGYAIKSEDPILELHLFVYTYKNHPKLGEINGISSGIDIKELGLTPVTNIGNNWHKINIDSHGVDTHYVPTENNAFDFLAARRADILIEPLFTGTFLINQMGLSDKVIPTEAKFGPLVFHLLMSKKSPYAAKMDQINLAIKRVTSSARYQAILNQYEEIQ